MALDPAVILTAPVVEQVLKAVPATAPGSGLMINDFVEETLLHPAFETVNVRVIVPAMISAALGVKVQVVKEFAFAKVPLPFELQLTEV